MESPIQFSESIFDALKKRAGSEADIRGINSGLFILSDAPVAGIQLSIPVEAYLQRMSTLDDDTKPKRLDIIPTGNKDFPIIVNAPVTIVDGKSFIDEKEVLLVF